VRKLPFFAILWVVFLLPVSAKADSMSVNAAAQRLSKMVWYSEEYPPYNFKKDGVAAGMSVDILMAAFRRVGVKVTPKDIRIVPWNRSYKYIQKKPGTALFSMTYTPERRKIMKFVGPAVSVRVSIIAPKKADLGKITADSLSEFDIGVVRDDIGDQLIRKFPLSSESIHRKNSLKQLFYLLRSGRVDVVAYAADVFSHAVRNAGDDPADYVELMVLKEGKMGYAFHNSTDPDVLAPLQKAVDELWADGTIAKIISAY